MNRKGSALVIVAFVAAVILIAGGIWYYRAIKNSTAPVITTTIASSTDNVGWNLYTNQIFGFSIEYPASYDLQENNDLAGNWTSATIVQITDPQVAPSTGDEFDISLAKQPLVNGGPIYQTIDDLLAYDKSNAATYQDTADTYQKIKINGMDAVQSMSNNTQGDSLAPSAAEGYDFLQNSIIYSLSWDLQAHGSFSKMAGTFKFLSK